MEFQSDFDSSPPSDMNGRKMIDTDHLPPPPHAPPSLRRNRKPAPLSSSSSPKDKLQGQSSSSSGNKDRDRDSDPNSYDYAPVDKARMELSEWPREADYSNLDDYFRQYYNIVAKSEGFTSFVDPTSTLVGGIRPCEVGERVLEAADCAVQKHNSEGPSVITLKRILKANRQVQVRSVYYITLEAAEGDGTTLYYETKVRATSKPGRYEVEFFRTAVHQISSDIVS